ncbi:MAG TPA: Rrf2 family transcriptional regulator [bacterium]|jgi:Rrf2 family protein|nr:Rrf2 family transcriptional regulator [bacterium]
MKFSSTEEYGLRCMLQMARKGHKGMTTIVELSQKEDLTPAYVAKIMGILRKGGLVQSLRGQSGGYQLSKPPQEINVNEVLEALGGKFFSREEYCSTASGEHETCIHAMDCSIRSLWTGLSNAMTGYLERCKLSDLVVTEPQMEKWISQKTSAVLTPAAQRVVETPKS